MQRRSWVWFPWWSAFALIAACGGDGGGVSAPTSDAGSEPGDSSEDMAGVDAGMDAVGVDAGSDVSDVVTFESHILPLFERTGCLGCHTVDVAKGGHQLHTLDALLTTGAHAPVVVPCDVDGSVLLDKLLPEPPFGDQMPQGGPYYEDEDLALLRGWIAAGADRTDCDIPEDPLPVIEERVFRVSDRSPLMTQVVELPDGVAGASALFSAYAGHEYGHVGAGGSLWRVGRGGEVDLVEPGWDGDRDLVSVRGLVALPGGPTLVATGIGLLYKTEGRLWPSPVDEVLQSPVHEMLADEAVDPGNPAVWFATGRGLFQLVGEEVFSVRPSEQAEGTAVGAIAVGPDPEDAVRRAIWASYGDDVYALRPDSDGVMAYTFEIGFDDTVVDIEADAAGRVWVVTSKGLYLRRPANLLGVSPWIHWLLPDGQRAVDVAVHDDGAVWVLTDAALYRGLDADWRWQLALGAPATDVVGMSTGDQGRVWLTRGRELLSLSPVPTAALVGVNPGETLNSFPPLTVYPSSPELVTQVSVGVDDCAPVELDVAPYQVSGGALLWGDCLTTGAHVLSVGVAYEGLDPVLVEVSFGWAEREEAVTWQGHIAPEVYMRSCARPGCHIDGFSPDTYEAWTEKVDQILHRTNPETVQGRMPPNGPRLTEAERLLIQWWRDDGFLFE
jgi:hypothetical protein